MRACTRQVPHVADLGLVIYADTLEELFAEAARAIAAYGRPRRKREVASAHVRLSARDAAALLADWINELLGLSEIHRVGYRHARLTIRSVGTRVELCADLTGSRLDEWRCPIKAATYHGLKLEQRGGRWRAHVLCDV